MQPGCESLESRTYFAFNPSAREQAALELINRMRQAPAAELKILLNTRNQDVKDALAAFDVNLNTLNKQWATLTPVAPVAWNESLYLAAIEHTKVMIARDGQEHQFSGEPGLRERITAQGYTEQSFLGENIFAYTEGVFHAHAGFAIDWGNGPGGIQNPAGHRITIMNPNYKEVGISILNAPKSPASRTTGPLLTTQDFGGDVSNGDAFLLGTVRREKNGDKVYDPGEGLGKINITLTGNAGTFTTTTLSAGAFQLKVPPGVYTVTARGLAIGGTITKKNVVMSADNIKTDFILSPDKTPPVPTLAASNITKSGPKTYSFKVTYKDNVAVAANSIATGDLEIVGPNGFKTTPTLVEKTPGKNAGTITATYRFTPPGGSWNAADNGDYSIRLGRSQVKDIFNRATPAGTLGSFTVAAGNAARTNPARPRALALPSRSASSPFAFASVDPDESPDDLLA